ncbi:MAG: hypothetical protein ABEK50_08370 [bacterium]
MFGWSSLLSILLAWMLSVGPVSSKTVDFGELQQEKNSGSLPSLLDNKERLWSGKAKQLHLETGLFSDDLLVVSATSKKLFVSTGGPIDLLSGSISKRLPGRIVNLDLKTSSGSTEVAHVAVTLVTGNTLKTKIFDLTKTKKDNLTLTQVFRTNWALVRNVEDSFYRQEFDPQSGWVDEIVKIDVSPSSGPLQRTLRIPKTSRLDSLSHIDDNRWVFLEGNGHLVLVVDGERTAVIEGNFGRSSRTPTVGNGRSKQFDPDRFLRLAPVYLKKDHLLAVVNNPSPGRGIMNIFRAGETHSSIELFELSNDSLKKIGSIGPQDGRVLDVDVSDANPNQLLWIQQLDDKTVSLEMIDFRSVDTPR